MSQPDLGDRLRSWLTLEQLRRHRTAIEAVAAGLYLLVIAPLILTSGGWGSSPGVVSIGSVLLLTVTLLLYRRLPFLALLLAAVGEVGMLVSGLLWSPVSLILLLPLLPAFFGAAAYGRPATRWISLPGTVLAGACALLVGNWYYYGADWGVGGVLLLYLFVVALLALAWLGGFLLTTLKARETAETGQIAATARLGEARQEVTLEQERNRVARDVHDIVAHSLAVVIAQADGARYASKNVPAPVAEALENIAATARGALTDVRVLLGELRHNQEAGPQPGMDDLDALVRGFRESGLELRWSSYGEAAPLGEAAGLAVYRIVQEALTNALRHGERGAAVDLEFDWGASTLAITVTNDVPAGASGHGNPGGHGLPGMRERATLAGGDFLAGGGTNGRFRVRATIPVERAATGTVPVAPAAP